MDNNQRKFLEESIRTWQKWASRYSQRPGQNWPAQELVLLQITDIDGLGQKKTSSRCRKTAVMACGHSQAIKLYKKWVDSNGGTRNGARDFVDHCTSDIDTLKSFWTTTEEKFVNVEATSTATGTTQEDGSNVTPVTTYTKKPPSASTTESIRNDARSGTSHPTKSRTVPTVTSTSNGLNNDSTCRLLNCKNLRHVKDQTKVEHRLCLTNPPPKKKIPPD
jgi:hypothetical protein